MLRATLRWNDRAHLRHTAAPGQRARILAAGHLLEMLHFALHTPDLSGCELCGVDCGSVLALEDMRSLFRVAGVATMFPWEGYEAHALIAASTIAETIAPPFFRGTFGEARRRVALLPDADRAAAYVVTHDEIHTAKALTARGN